jgi:chorismate synthase
MLLENIDVFAERPRMGLQRVTEVIALGEHNWVSMRSGIAKQYTFGTTITGQMWRRDLNRCP